MKTGAASCLVLTLAMTAPALAANPPKAPKRMSTDASADFLIDAAAAEQIWKENMPARVLKLYPVKKYRYASEVSGGFTENKTCVITARAMLLPVVHLPLQGPKAVYAPIKAATAFDAVPSLSQAQCQDLAKAKLKEAVQSVASALAAS
jgi:hypothetical protein